MSHGDAKTAVRFAAWVALTLALIVLFVPIWMPICECLKTIYWRKVNCTIIRSIAYHDPDYVADFDIFKLDLRYSYVYSGSSNVSSTFHVWEPEAFGSHRRIASLAARYPEGSQAWCFVNPFHPGRAVVLRMPSMEKLVDETLYNLYWEMIPMAARWLCLLTVVGSGYVLIRYRSQVHGLHR